MSPHSSSGTVCLNQTDDRGYPRLSFYILYTPIYLIALSANIIIYLAHLFWKERVLVKRDSANFLLRSQNVLDCFTCLLLLANVSTNLYEAQHSIDYRTVPILVMFYSFRNVLVGLEMFALSLNALDRMMAVCYPLSQRWTGRLVRTVFYIGTSGILLCDLGARIVIILQSNCQTAETIEEGYSIAYAVSALVIVCITYTSYVLLFVRLNTFWKQRQTRQLQVNQRLRTWTAHSVQQDASIQEPQQQQQQYSSSSLSESLVDGRWQQNVGTQKQQPQLAGIPENAATMTAAAVPSTSFHLSMSAEKRLALILFALTVSHTVSILPLVLYNLDVITFPGYDLYYLFYLNGVINPCIHFLTRPELRQFVRLLFTKPRLALTTN